jgi:hypothetical protein
MAALSVQWWDEASEESRNRRMEIVRTATKLRELRELSYAANETLVKELMAKLSLMIGAEADPSHVVSQSVHGLQIERHRYVLIDVLDARHVASNMFLMDALTSHELESILQCLTGQQAAILLLDMLVEERPEVFKCFLDALLETNQRHLLNRFTSPEGSSGGTPVEQELRRLAEQKAKVLAEMEKVKAEKTKLQYKLKHRRSRLPYAHRAPLALPRVEVAGFEQTESPEIDPALEEHSK